MINFLERTLDGYHISKVIFRAFEYAYNKLPNSNYDPPDMWVEEVPRNQNLRSYATRWKVFLENLNDIIEGNNQNKDHFLTGQIAVSPHGLEIHLLGGGDGLLDHRMCILLRPNRTWHAKMMGRPPDNSITFPISSLEEPCSFRLKDEDMEFLPPKRTDEEFHVYRSLKTKELKRGAERVSGVRHRS